MYIAEFIREKTVLQLLHGAIVAVHKPHKEREQQLHDGTANLVEQFVVIIEEISVTMRQGMEMEAKSYKKEEQQSSQLSLPFDFKIQCSQYTSSKRSKAIPIEIIISNDTDIAAKDTTIPGRCAFPISVIGNILPFLPPCNLFFITMTINICQESQTHVLVIKAAINYFRQMTTEHADYVTTINSLNTVSYLCAIIRTSHVPTPMRLLHLVNGKTCEFFLIH